MTNNKDLSDKHHLKQALANQGQTQSQTAPEDTPSNQDIVNLRPLNPQPEIIFRCGISDAAVAPLLHACNAALPTPIPGFDGTWLISQASTEDSQLSPGDKEWVFKAWKFFCT